MTKKEELVSICIPAYEDADGLSRLLKSICKQDYKNIEVIISDDSKSDACKKVSDEFDALLDIKYLRHKASGRPADNWNNAVRNAKGKYIKMMLHDDFFNKNYAISRFVEMLEEENTAFAFSGTRETSESFSYERHILDKDAKLLEDDIRNLYLGSTIGAPSATIYYNKGYEYDRKLKWLIDTDFYLSYIRGESQKTVCRLKFTYTNEALIGIGRSDKQLTNYCQKHPNLVRFEYLYLYFKHKLHKVKQFDDEKKDAVADISNIDEDTAINVTELRKVEDVRIRNYKARLLEELKNPH